MNEATLKRLKNNPHYKMNAKEKAELEELERQRRPMVEFGQTPIHQQEQPEFERHQVVVVKRGRKKK